MTEENWTDLEAPRKIATVIASISVIIPGLLLSFTILSLRSDFVSNQVSADRVLALLSSFCLVGTIASARCVDWLMDSLSEREWKGFFSARSHDVTTALGRVDQFIFRATVFQGGYLLLSLVYSGFAVLFTNLTVIFLEGFDIFERWYVLLPTLLIAVAIFYQMMTDRSRFAGTAMATAFALLAGGVWYTST